MLLYLGPDHGYVDSGDREELAAIAREEEARVRAARVGWRVPAPLTGAEVQQLMRARKGVDRLALRAEGRRRGGRLVKTGVRGSLFLAVSR